MSSPTSGSQATASAPTRPRGRPREFDREEVLDRVMALFWERGFELTSMSDIVEATGLHKSSLYNAFGSKESLFSLAFDRYVSMQSSMMTEFLVNGSEGLADVEMFLEVMQAKAYGEHGGRGCLAVNTCTELATRDDDVVKVSAGFRDQIRTALRAALDRAEAAGEIAPGSAERHAAIFLSFILSIGVIARSGADAAELQAQFEAARRMLADWRVPQTHLD